MTKAECIAYVKSHMEIRYATNNGAYKARRFINPVGDVNHSVGCAQPNPEVFFNAMNKSSAGWGVTAILGGFDKGEGKIILTLPMNARNWGCGKGKKGTWNDSHIQWEICEPAGHTYAGGTMINYNVKKNQVYFDRMWKLVVAWNVYVCDYFGIKPTNIHDHAESYKHGFGSNHSDVNQWWPKHGKNMQTLRDEVTKILNGETEKVSIIHKTEIPYDVVVAAGSSLNCRDNPRNGKIVKQYKDGEVVTISKLDGEWGYTGEGWIHLGYTNVFQKEEDILDMTKDELTKLIDERLATLIKTYENIDDVPTYWRDTVKELIAMDIINGGTDNKINDKDVNLNIDTIKAIVILKAYIDKMLKK